VAQFLGIDSDNFATQALQAAGVEEARNTLLSTLQSAATARRNSFADLQTKAEHEAAFRETGANFFAGIEIEVQRLSSTVATAVTDNPMIDWLKRLHRDPNAIIAYFLNILAYDELKVRAGIVGRGLAACVVNEMLMDRKRVRLVGHSFGGRVMTAATAEVEGKISNLTLLEAAFSHNGLSVEFARPAASTSADISSRLPRWSTLKSATEFVL